VPTPPAGEGQVYTGILKHVALARENDERALEFLVLDLFDAGDGDG
jgi:hypothetical protein